MIQNSVIDARDVGRYSGVDTWNDLWVLARFGALVRPDGDWDHKPKLARRFGGGHAYRTAVPGDYAPESLYYDVWSNIHYGFVGRGHNIPAGTLMRAQKWIGVTDAGDDIAIRLGMSLWDKFRRGLTKQQLADAVRDTVPAWRDATDFHVRGPLHG